ncbi:MAG: hypothetical protein ACREEM_28970 [Blastocatellia bacterium]
MATIEPEISELHAKEIAELRGTVHQLDKTVNAASRQTIWQFIALLATLFIAIAGGLVYQTNMIDKRMELLERNQAIHYQALKEQNQVLKDQIIQIEKNMNARFEDLKQEVRANRR